MASASHVQIYYYLRVLLQDMQKTLDATATLGPANVHRQIVDILRSRVKPLLKDRSLADDVDIATIYTRIGDAIDASIRDTRALAKLREKLKGDPTIDEQEARQAEHAAIEKWMRQWISSIQECIGALAYIHPDLVAAVDHVMNLIMAASLYPNPGAPIAAGDLAQFVVALVPVGNPAADSPIHRANLAVLGAVQAARLQTASAIAEFLRRDFAASTDLMNQLQGNPHRVVIQNVCTNCGRVVRAAKYSEESSDRFVCAKTDPQLHTSLFIRRCDQLAQERKNAALSYLANEREGVHFETPASFTAWANSGNFRITKLIYGPRATASEMCHLSRNGYLKAFNELWTSLPYESRLYVLNCSLRGHHVDAFPDLLGRETIRLEVASVIQFLSLRVVRNDAALARIIESRGDQKKQVSPRKMSRLSADEIGVPIASVPQSLSSSSSSFSAADAVPNANAVTAVYEDDDDDEDMLVYTRRDRPDVADRDIVQRAEFYAKESERRQKRAILTDETDTGLLQEIKVDDIVTTARVFDDESDNESDVDSEFEASHEEDSSMADEVDVELQAEEERVKKRTVAEIKEEIRVQDEVEKMAMAGLGDKDVRTAWTFTYRDMKNALYLLTSTTFAGNRTRLDGPTTPNQLKTLAQLVLFCVLPPSDHVANVKTVGNGEVSVIPLDDAAPTQHSRLFEHRLKTTAAQIGLVKPGDKNIVDHMLSKSAMTVISEAVGVDKKEPREDLKPVAGYLAYVARKKTPWAQIRNGNLSEFPDADVPDTAREDEIVKAMQPYFNYATGLFPVRQATGHEKTHDDMITAIWSTGYKVVDGIADGILPPFDAEDAWDRLAETSPRRLGSLMRVLSKLFGAAGSVYFTKRDWAGLIVTTDSLIRRSTSEVEIRVKRKLRRNPSLFTQDYENMLMKKAEASVRSFNVRDYAKMASTMLGWISIIVPRNLRLLQMMVWQAPYDPWVLDKIKQHRVLQGLVPSNVDEDQQDDAERDMTAALAMMEKDILTEIRGIRRREIDEKEAARTRFFGGHNVSLMDLRTYVDLWGRVNNPRDRARLTPEQQTEALNRMSELERAAFPEEKRIGETVQRLSVAKETLASLVHETGVFTSADVHGAIADDNPTANVMTFVDRLKAQGLDAKIIDAADEVVRLRKTIDEEKRVKHRHFYLGQWIYTKRRILNDDIFSEKGDPEGTDPEVKLHIDLEISAREVFPQVLDIESLRIAQKEVIASLDETTRGYINSRSDHELRHMVKRDQGNDYANYSAAGIAEVLRLRGEVRKLERELAKDQQILVDFVISAAQENEDPELRVSQRTKLSQRLLFTLGYIWPTLDQRHVGNVPKELIDKINAETRAARTHSLARHMVIVDPVVAEAIWSGTSAGQILENAKKPLDYKVSVLVHGRDFLQRCDPLLAHSLFTMHRELGYPWQDDDFRFVLQWNYVNSDITFECFNKLVETCRRPENTRWRRMLLDTLGDAVNLDRVYPVGDPRRVHSRLRESVLKRIPLTERELVFLLQYRWDQLGPDELSNFPQLTESQIQFVNQRIVDNALIQRLGPINAMGIHKLYVFSRLTPDGMKNVFNPEAKADEAYPFIKKQGMELKVVRKNQEFCEFKDMPGVTHRIAKVRAYGPFFKGATNFARQSFFIGDVEVSFELHGQLK